MKKALNILILLAIIWILATSGTEDISLLFTNTAVLGTLVFFRVNIKDVVEFFNEKEEL